MGKKVEELPFSIKCRQSAQNSSLDIIHSFMGITLEVSVSRKTIFFLLHGLHAAYCTQKA